MWDDCFSFPELLVRVNRAYRITVAVHGHQGQAAHAWNVKVPLPSCCSTRSTTWTAFWPLDRAVGLDPFAFRSEWEKHHDLSERYGKRPTHAKRPKKPRSPRAEILPVRCPLHRTAIRRRAACALTLGITAGALACGRTVLSYRPRTRTYYVRAEAGPVELHACRLRLGHGATPAQPLGRFARLPEAPLHRLRRFDLHDEDTRTALARHPRPDPARLHRRYDPRRLPERHRPAALDAPARRALRRAERRGVVQPAARRRRQRPSGRDLHLQLAGGARERPAAERAQHQGLAVSLARAPGAGDRAGSGRRDHRRRSGPGQSDDGRADRRGPRVRHVLDGVQREPPRPRRRGTKRRTSSTPSTVCSSGISAGS